MRLLSVFDSVECESLLVDRQEHSEVDARGNSTHIPWPRMPSKFVIEPSMGIFDVIFQFIYIHQKLYAYLNEISMLHRIFDKLI
jgi:hypothetical protein